MTARGRWKMCADLHQVSQEIMGLLAEVHA